MGTLYWQLNDTWPAISWSSRDYFGRWKALHFAARDAFAPILISPSLREDTLEIWGASDLMEDREGELKLELLDFDGTVLWEETNLATLPANESHLLWTGSSSAILGESDPARTVLSVALAESGDGGKIHTALLYFQAPRELELGVPAIALQVQEDNESITLTLTTDVLAKDVYLTLEGARFSHNFFDLLPGKPLTIRVGTELPARGVETRLRIKTLAEVPREGLEIESGGSF
jgi:beta-mannosidase